MVLFISINSFSHLAQGGSQTYAVLSNCGVERYCCCELFLLVPLKPEPFPPGKQMRLQIKHTHKISCLFTNSSSEVHIQPSIWWWLGCCLHRCLKCAVVKILSPFLAFLPGGISPLFNCFSLSEATQSHPLDHVAFIIHKTLQDWSLAAIWNNIIWEGVNFFTLVANSLIIFI